MLWKKKKATGDVTETAGPAEPGSLEPRSPSDKALDVVVALLRQYGKHAFDTDMAEAETVAARCEDWATRISIGTPRRDGPGTSSAPAGPFRDWTGLLAFWREQRSGESEFVMRTLGSYREAILGFAACLSKTIVEERESDARLDERLGTLRRAIQSRDPERVVTEAEAVARAVRDVMDQRRRREDEDLRLLGEHVRELRLELSEVRKKAEMDSLTQLSNRAALDAHVGHLVSLSALLAEPPLLLLADLDHFKAVNDTYGHPVGDEVLRQVSHCLSRTFLRKQDFVARYGGEEFATVLLDTTSEQAQRLADRLMDGVRALVVQHGGRELQVTLSLGLAALHPGDTASSWLARADAALYRAKREGRNCCRIEP
jgi:diguanylate cyclase